MSLSNLGKPKIKYVAISSVSTDKRIAVSRLVNQYLTFTDDIDNLYIKFEQDEDHQGQRPLLGQLDQGITLSDQPGFLDEFGRIFRELEQLKVSLLSSLEPKKEPTRSKDDSETEENKNYRAVEPYYSFDHLILPEETMKALEESIGVFAVHDKVFNEWGFASIEPFPKSALNFYGPPGVGKTLSAHALASKLGKKIMVASYADIESKYHGDGPKNVQAIFSEAQSSQAVLFIDEADSLLSKRLTNVSQGSEQAINSMRSQLLICLEQFKGIVIFSTNLVSNYDKAFETRIRHISFQLPDRPCRQKLWERHIPEAVPSRVNIDFVKLSEVENVCGRDIKNACINAAVASALAGETPTTELLIDHIDTIISSRIETKELKVQDTSDEMKARIRNALKKKKDIPTIDAEPFQET